MRLATRWAAAHLQTDLAVMADQWHYQLFGEEFGPVAEETLRELLAQGTLGNDDPVRRNGGKWIPAQQALPAKVAHDSAAVVATLSEEESAAADEKSEWYCQILGQELGPLSFNELLKFAEGGELQADDQIRFGATGKWRRVGSVGRLVSVLPYSNNSVTRVGKKAAPQPVDPTPAPQAPAATSPAIPSQPAYAPAASEMTWYAWIRGVEYGPSSLLQLQQYLASGQLAATDFVKYGSTGAWCPPTTVAQMLSQYVVTTPTPQAIHAPSVPAPAVKNSAVNVPTVAAPKPEVAAAKIEVTSPVPMPAAAVPAAKAEPPRLEPEKPAVIEAPPKPAPVPPPPSISSYGSSAASRPATSTVSPPKPIARPVKSSGGGSSIDFSSMLDAKTIGIGGGVIAAAVLVVGFLYMPAGTGLETRYFKELHEIFAEFQRTREKNGSAAELKAVTEKIEKRCPEIAAILERNGAGSQRPMAQKLLFVAKYNLPKMVSAGLTKSTAEIEAEKMLYDVAKELQIPMDPPKPAETKASQGSVNPNLDKGT